MREAGIADMLTKPVPVGPRHAAAPSGGQPSREVSCRATPGKRPRILVVEDNPVNQMVATGLLAASATTVDTAEDGLAGSRPSTRRRFDAC